MDATLFCPKSLAEPSFSRCSKCFILLSICAYLAINYKSNRQPTIFYTDKPSLLSCLSKCCFSIFVCLAKNCSLLHLGTFSLSLLTVFPILFSLIFFSISLMFQSEVSILPIALKRSLGFFSTGAVSLHFSSKSLILAANSSSFSPLDCVGCRFSGF